MISLPLMTAEDFVERRHELPDGGRWAELIRGVPYALQPPDETQGTVVLNLSKAFARQAQKSDAGYACFELGIIVERSPDTVWQPAVVWFDSGERFAEIDKQVTNSIPSHVVDIVSTNDRRRGLNERIAGWHDFGVSMVWVIDPLQQQIHEIAQHGAPNLLTNGDILRGQGPLGGFEIPVADLFAEPEFGHRPKRPKG